MCGMVSKQKKEAVYNSYHRYIGLCCVGTKYYAEDKCGEDLKSCQVKKKKKSHAFCRSVMEAI